ncbi:MAG TPA: dihydrolipoamide acetyltransferase family protein [Galbitalea sp.]|jgi:pyruvate dehydrogenase E2 component (dihydrolipoamide acetyltransferase)
MTRDFTLPDLGEGLTESELVAWHVVVGDLVELNQPIAEVETAKAIVQLPSPFAGVISALYVEPGTTVTVGSPLVAFELDGPADVEVVDDAEPVPQADAAAKPARNAVLVGYGPPVEGGERPKRKRASRPLPAQVAPAGPAAERVVQDTPRSTPPVRKLAADLGIDLALVSGTGDAGTITRSDVLAATSTVTETATSVSAGTVSAGTVSAGLAAPTPVRAPQSGERETRTPIKGVRKATAEAMVQSAFTAPHVTEFLTIDVTAASELLAELRESKAFAGQRITMLALVAKALLLAVDRTPSVNSRWDDAAAEIVQFGYVNLGIAVATPRGLMVPNIRDADQLSLVELAASLTDLAETARSGATTPQSLTGGTISITNVGVFGVDAGTPILNPGEAAILAMGAVRRLPWEYRGEIALRDVMTLSLSFDHRLVDGEQGSRFLTDIGAILKNPGMALTMV